MPAQLELSPSFIHDMLRAILFLSIVLKARGIIDSSADVTVKVFSGLALRIEDGSFFVADTQAQYRAVILVFMPL